MSPTLFPSTGQGVRSLPESTATPLRAELTFAIPFYGERRYLERAVASVLRQSNPDWELIVCDDCSPERGVRDLLESYGDPRCHYVRNGVNLGMAGNWNRCLDLAPTDLVNLLHGDDQLLEGYAALMTEAAARYPNAVALFCGARVIDENGRGRFSFPDFVKRFLVPGGGVVTLRGQEGLEALLHGDFIMCPTVCYRKSLLGPRRFSESWKMVQDLEFFTRLLLDGETLVGLAAVSYAYRRHGENATAAYTANLLRFREEAQLYDELARAAAGRGWARAARLARRKRIVKLHLLYRVAADLLRLRPGRAWRQAEFLWRLAARGS